MHVSKEFRTELELFVRLGLDLVARLLGYIRVRKVLWRGRVNFAFWTMRDRLGLIPPNDRNGL